ncbi:cytochrome c oxidase, cbb3-type, CcoQ subunit [Helicobacter himalayensis]|uniref:cytochrome c oxidase, cbb3-type, CcoQ subunit n=1 Tax=Helicobacter himalayensis TaxID=1591088 RepID=UPI00082D4BE8|nr:cytochrome c oxidase, cbb3-type, CcoQ subunit [Helicobacter himalayensis]
MSEIGAFIVRFISEHANGLYTLCTLVCVVFLYGYIYHLYSSQKKGKRDYEKYADLALKDDLNDALIEPLENEKALKKGK